MHLNALIGDLPQRNRSDEHAAEPQIDLEEVYNTECHLLYVACARARDHLLVTGIGPGSEFLDDLSLASPAT